MSCMGDLSFVPQNMLAALMSGPQPIVVGVP